MSASASTTTKTLRDVEHDVEILKSEIRQPDNEIASVLACLEAGLTDVQYLQVQKQDGNHINIVNIRNGYEDQLADIGFSSDLISDDKYSKLLTPILSLTTRAGGNITFEKAFDIRNGEIDNMDKYNVNLCDRLTTLKKGK